MTESNPDVERITKAAEALSEFFDTVHILATRQESEGMYKFSIGRGSYYARYGQMREWIIEQDEITRQKARSRQEDD